MDIVSFAWKGGGGFFLELITWYAIKRVIKLAAITVGLFFVALAYLEHWRIVSVVWNRI